MERIMLGNTDLSISPLGLGGCPFGGHGWGHVSDRDSIAAIHRALDLGVIFFDTADVYGLGHSESILAKALGKERHGVVIATKFGVRRTADGKTVKDTRPAYVRQAIEASLKRLKLDCIPLYYVHYPDGKTPVEDTIEELVRCRQAGKIQEIGVSNFDARQLASASQITRIAAAQVQYSLIDREVAESLLPTSLAQSVALVTWGSLAQGLLSGKFDAKTQFADNDRRQRYENFQSPKFESNLRVVARLQEVAARVGRTPAQVAMRWLLDTKGVGCVLFGAKSPRQVEENMLTLGWQLDPAEHASLGALAATELARFAHIAA